MNANHAPEGLAPLEAEVERLRRENAELRRRLGEFVQEPAIPYQADSGKLPLEAAPLPQISNASPAEEKINLFRMLFKAREDVYAVRWVSDRTGKKGYSPACEDPKARHPERPS